jgi:hypothetical protein
MRDQRFVAIHRGGLLSREEHGQLMKWAYDCICHVLPLFSGDIDDRLNLALTIAKAWENGQASVREARVASLQSYSCCQ